MILFVKRLNTRRHQMDYLKKYNITSDMLKEISKINDPVIFNKLYTYEPTVTKNLDYVVSIGFTNIYDLLRYKLDVIFETNLNKRINFKVVELLNKDIFNIEDFGY